MADFIMVTDNTLEGVAVARLVEEQGHNLTSLALNTVSDNGHLLESCELGIIDADSVAEAAVAMTEYIHKQKRKLPLIWLTMNVEDERLNYASMAAGASGCLSKSVIADLVPSLERAMAGEPLYTKSMLMSFIRSFAPRTPVVTAPLSPREQAILRMLQQGSTNREIAKRLSLSVETIKHHVADLKDALQLKHRRQFSMGVSSINTATQVRSD